MSQGGAITLLPFLFYKYIYGKSYQNGKRTDFML